MVTERTYAAPTVDANCTVLILKYTSILNINRKPEKLLIWYDFHRKCVESMDN
jgi:hypothetical protein